MILQVPAILVLQAHPRLNSYWWSYVVLKFGVVGAPRALSESVHRVHGHGTQRAIFSYKPKLFEAQQRLEKVVNLCGLTIFRMRSMIRASLSIFLCHWQPCLRDIALPQRIGLQRVNCLPARTQASGVVPWVLK